MGLEAYLSARPTRRASQPNGQRPAPVRKAAQPKLSKHVDRSSVACRTKLTADAAAKADVNAASQSPAISSAEGRLREPLKGPSFQRLLMWSPSWRFGPA